MKKHTAELGDLMGDPKQKSIGNVLFILFILIVIGLSFYVGWLKYDLNTKKSALETAIKNLEEAEKKEIEKEGYSKSEALKEAKLIWEKAEAFRIKWSHIYTDVIALEQGRVTFYNFSADQEKHFNVNGITPSMENISGLLNQLKNNPKFEKPFVSQIAEVQKDNKKAFSFILSFDYQQQPEVVTTKIKQ